ncbi:MAG: response regulator [Anaerolineales bacterium]|nr:response regulator [Chloroflexota bacterium]MBL6982413.1 response regulator [Anaerolineales bacterium]
MIDGLKGKRIFLVEDNAMNIAIYSTSLRSHGAIIYKDVLGYGIVKHIVESLPIDIIVLDIMLRRGINGYDIFDLIRSEPKICSIPIVAVTSLDPETEIPKAKEKGFDGFISKPINSQEFPKQLASIMSGEKLWVISR